jgi:nucleoside recognition membrane protein YjiH
MKNTMRKNVKRTTIQVLILIICFLAVVSLKAESNITTLVDDLEHMYGMYIVDLIKMVLGIITIIGAFGFFITTSPKRAHWPAHFRRIFFGIFVFCNIIGQAFFNVLSVPTNKKLICILGKCVKKLSPH